MSRLTQKGATGVLEMFKTSTDSSLATLVGTRYDSADGREFVLVQNGATALTAGTLIQAPVAVGTTHQNLAVTAYSAATTSALATVTVTLGATLATVNQYQGGYLSVHDGTGVGQFLKIAKHPAAALSTSMVVTLEDAPVTALDTTSKVDLVLNPYGSANGTNTATNGVLLQVHGTLVPVVGVCTYAIAASSSTVPTYGLLQTKGPASILAHGTPAIGLDLGASASVDGAVDAYAVATGCRIGTAMITGVDTKYLTANVQL